MPYLFDVLRSIAMPGWIAGPIQVGYGFSGTIGNTNQFPDIDQQKREMLSEFGCASLTRRIFQRGQRYLYTSAFEFATPEGAFAAYNYMREGASTVVTRGSASSEDDQSISFWKDKYFISLLQTSQDDEESKEGLQSIATELERRIPSTSDPPRILSNLPVIDRVRGSEKLVMGPNSGRQFFPAPYLGALTLEKAVGAATADYAFHSPYPERLKLLYIDYGDPVAASRAYETYIGGLGEPHPASPSESGESATTSLFKLSNSYMLCQLRGPKLAIIMGARKRISPMFLARQLP